MTASIMFLKTAPLTRDVDPRRVRVDQYSAVRRSHCAKTMDGRLVSVSYEGESRNKYIKRLERAGWIVQDL